MLKPRKALPFAPPKPSYLKYGPLDFNEGDISSEKALVAVEHDYGFQRVDNLSSFAEMKEKVASGQGLLNCYQLADSFMKGVAFKMDKLAKFGA